MKSSLLRSMDPLLPNSLKHGIAPSLYPIYVPAIRKFSYCLSTRFDSCDSLGLSFLTLSMPLGGPSHNTHAALRFPWQLKLGFEARMSGFTVPGSFLLMRGKIHHFMV